MRLGLNNGKIFTGKLERANITIENGIITKISKKIENSDKEIDCTGKIILPGAIDVHVHFRSPGLEYKEDMVSGSLAAIHGGITTVMDMPNTKPPTLTGPDLEEKRKIASKDCAVNFDAYMGANGENLDEIKNAKNLRGVKIYFGSSTGNLLLNNEEKIAELFEVCKERGVVVAVHAEDEEEIKKNGEKFSGRNDPKVHSVIRSDVAEQKAILSVLKLQQKIKNKIHIAHISSKKALGVIVKVKKISKGLVTCEVTPNHLFLDSSDYKKFGNLIKCNPSIKTLADKNALWKGLISRKIDIVATDHAPHSLEEKNKDYWSVPSGIPGVETMMPLMLDAIARKKITLERVVEACSQKPAEIFGWKNKGFIREGFDADLIIVDMTKSYKVENVALFTKAGYSPFSGQKLKGFVEKTIVGGEVYG